MFYKNDIIRLRKKVIDLISKENKEITIAPINFPEKSSGFKPTQKQMKKAIDDAIKDFREIDLPELEKKYHPSR